MEQEVFNEQEDFKVKLEVIRRVLNDFVMDRKVYSCDSLYAYLRMATLALDSAIDVSKQYNRYDNSRV